MTRFVILGIPRRGPYHTKHMYLQEADIRELRSVYTGQARATQDIAERAGKVQAMAKRSIFAVHRDDLAGANALLRDALATRTELIREYTADYLQTQSAWRAFGEELLEAQLFVAFAEERWPFELPVDQPERVIGALSDLLGEVARLVVRDVTVNPQSRYLAAARGLAEEVIDALLELDATGHARQKVDQARQHARKIEDVAYDVSFRRRV